MIALENMPVAFTLAQRASGRVIFSNIGKIILKWQFMNLDMDFWICPN